MNLLQQVSSILEFSLNNETQKNITEEEEHDIVALGRFATIKLAPFPYGGIHVRIVKHGNANDLFPAEFLVSQGGLIQVSGTPINPDYRTGVKYDLEIHVDIQHAELLQFVRWNENLRTGIFVRNGKWDIREYTNDKIELRVLDFEVLNGNLDGVFEPGGSFRIRNIKVQNLGKKGCDYC